MNFQFKNWKAFRDQLKSQDIKIATFDFVYEKCEFKIIYPMEQNAFYIYEPDNLEILGIVDIAYPMGSYLFFGHPYMGVMSGLQLPNFILQTEIARWGRKYSIWDFKFEFESPNIFRIRPVPGDMEYIILIYERVQPPDFSKIPNEFQRLFLDLCLADIMMLIGRIRKRYGDGNLKTPFGEIPIGAEIFEEGKELKEKLMEKMENTQIPNIRVSLG